jgi:hypothetical protein
MDMDRNGRMSLSGISGTGSNMARPSCSGDGYLGLSYLSL